MCVCVCVCAYMHAYIHTYIHTCVYCIYVYVYICVCVYVCICICVCVCVCMYVYVYIYIYVFFFVLFFFTVISPRFKLHLSVEKLKCDTIMPTFPPLQFYEIIVTQYQLRLTDAPGGCFCNGRLRGLGPKIRLWNSCPGLPGLLIWKCLSWYRNVPPETDACEWGQTWIVKVKGTCAFRKYYIQADNLSI